MAVVLLLLVLVLMRMSDSTSSSSSSSSSPDPRAWPEQFHALLYKNLTEGGGGLQITNQWYDWRKGRNVNIIQMQLGELLYGVEWNNGTTFYYTTTASGDAVEGEGRCDVVDYGVGIPRPDWLIHGSNYLGIQSTDGFLCNVWEKAEFVWYYEDVLTKLPVRWDFSDGISVHVMTFEVGAVLQDTQLLQAPAYCFTQKPLSQNLLHPNKHAQQDQQDHFPTK